MILDCISMDLLGHEPVKWVEMVQGDFLSRKLRIALYSGGTVWQVPEDTAVVIRYRRKNGIWGEYDTMPDGTPAWEVSGNMLTLTLVPQVVSMAGTVLLSVVFLKNEMILNSFSVELRIKKNIKGKGRNFVNEGDSYRCITGFLPTPDRAKEGQIIQVAEVDESGKVKSVAAVDMAEGSGSQHGGYYVPQVSQSDGNTMQVSFVPSQSSMPSVNAAEVILPCGRDGKDGYTPIKNVDYFDGADGKSAYQYAQEGGYSGTETQFAKKVAQEPLLGSADDITPQQVLDALNEGRNIVFIYTDATYGAVYFTGFLYVPALDVVASSGVQPFGSMTMRFALIGDIGSGNWIFDYDTIAAASDIPQLLPNPECLLFKKDGLAQQSYDGSAAVTVDIPTKLPNPNALTFTGAVTGSYDGSSAATIHIPNASGGSSGETIPEYVRTEAETVARIIHQHQSNDSIIIPFLSDAHCGYYQDEANAAAKLAGQLLSLIGKRVPFDFIANGGDMANGAYDTTREMTFGQNEDYTEFTAEAHKGVPAVWVPGNHDDAPYMATADRVTQTDMFALIGRKNRVSGAVCPDGCNYGYLDLGNRKLRVIYLDTDDKRSWETVQLGIGDDCPYMNAHNVGGVQLQWLADTALDFTDKTNPAEWSIVVISHVALNISGTITDAVSGAAYANSTANAAIILNAYRAGKSGSITHNGITASYDFSALESKATVICAVHGHNHNFGTETLVGGILSIGCPNVMNGRERVSDDGNTYTKTAGTADGTSFCILTIDRENCRIYADCVGAGYDREFTYTTKAVAYTNQLPISTDADGNIYNSKGFKEDTYLSSGNEGSRSGTYATGFIPCVLFDVLHCKNVGMQTGQDGHRLCFYNADKTHLGTVKTSITGYTGFTYGDDGNITEIRVNVSGDNQDTAFVRFCCSYLGEDSIITVNEPIA